MAEKYEVRMKAAGNRCDPHLYEGQSHGFFNYGRGRARCYRDTVHKMSKFLASLGYLEGEPTSRWNDGDDPFATFLDRPTGFARPTPTDHPSGLLACLRDTVTSATPLFHTGSWLGIGTFYGFAGRGRRILNGWPEVAD